VQSACFVSASSWSHSSLCAHAVQEGEVEEAKEETDELADLWRDTGAPTGATGQFPGNFPPGYQQHPGHFPSQFPGQFPGQFAPEGAHAIGSTNPFSMPPTGQVIQTTQFIAGPTGMLSNAPNPLLMPGAAPVAKPVGAPNPNNPFAQQIKASTLEDLSASALGFVKDTTKEEGPRPPLRGLLPGTVAAPSNDETSAAPLVAPVGGSSAQLIPQTPGYQGYGPSAGAPSQYSGGMTGPGGYGGYGPGGYGGFGQTGYGAQPQFGAAQTGYAHPGYGQGGYGGYGQYGAPGGHSAQFDGQSAQFAAAATGGYGAPPPPWGQPQQYPPQHGQPFGGHGGFGVSQTGQLPGPPAWPTTSPPPPQ
jgi:hypothetical protein